MNTEPYKAIGILDSGVGGLTVVKEFHRQLPNESIVYFGDTARFPYGPRAHDEVRRFSLEIIEFLQTQEVKMIIVACNSSTAAGLSYYQEQVDIPIIGVIEPGAQVALQETHNGKIGVIGTPGTISSGAYEKVLLSLDSNLEIHSKACPLLVLIVENNLMNTPEAYRVTEEYLDSLLKAGVDTIILGCTHYPLIKGMIQEVAGNDVKLISSAEAIAKEAIDFFSGDGLLNPLNSGRARHRYFVSGKPYIFEQIGSKFLAHDFKSFQICF